MSRDQVPALLRPLAFVDCADCLVRAATTEGSWTEKIANVGRAEFALGHEQWSDL
jgi:hypothetical protein